MINIPLSFAGKVILPLLSIVGKGNWVILPYHLTGKDA